MGTTSPNKLIPEESIIYCECDERSRRANLDRIQIVKDGLIKMVAVLKKSSMSLGRTELWMLIPVISLIFHLR